MNKWRVNSAVLWPEDTKTQDSTPELASLHVSPIFKVIGEPFVAR